MSRLRVSLASTLLACALAAPVASAQVLGGHPRIFLSATGHRGVTPATLRARCAASDSPWQRACRSAAPLPAPGTPQLFRNTENPLIVLALRYLFFEEPQTLQFIRDQLVSIGAHADIGNAHAQLVADLPKIRQLAIVYDWLYNVLPEPDRNLVESQLRSHAEWFLANEPTDVFASDAYLQATGVALAGLSLAGDPNAPDAGTSTADSDARRYLAYANTRWRTVLFPALAYTRGWWHEGAGIFLREVARPTLQYAAAWTTATDDDIFRVAQDSGGDVFNLWVRHLAHALRPDFRYSPFGDVSDDEMSSEGFTRPVLDLLAWGTGSSEAQSLALEVSARARVARDYVGTESWHQLLFYDSQRPTMPSYQLLPTAMHFSPTAEDVVVMRSGWGADDTWVTLSCGDWFSDHQRMDVAGIQVFRRVPLVVSTGYYDGFESPHWINWYAQHSGHASALAITQPGEIFPNNRMIPAVNDGGERPTYARTGRATLDQYRANLVAGAQYDTGGITAFEHAATHDYAACDATRAFNSTLYTSAGNRPKVREVTRQVVFLRPDVIVVFDRVEATDPTYVKRFTLHGLLRPVVDVNQRFVISQNTAHLIGQTLLPMGATQTSTAGFMVDGMNVAPLSNGLESGGAQLDVTAPTGNARDYFLHVLTTRDEVPARTLPWTRVEDGDRVGVAVTMPSDSSTVTVTFNRVGPVGGVLRVANADGATLYQGGLGSGGRFYTPVATPSPFDAGVVDAGANDGGLRSDGGPDVSLGDGCSCRASDAPQGPRRGFWMGLSLAAAVGLRRRRRAART